MRRRTRLPKASDLFARTEHRNPPVIPRKPLAFGEAFPTVAHIRIDVKSWMMGSPVHSSRVLDETTTSEMFDCDNPACYGGGTSIGDLLRKMTGEGLMELRNVSACKGHEGSPRARVQRSCMTFFEVSIQISYRAAEKRQPPRDEDGRGR